MSQSLVGADTASASSASAPTWTADTTAKGTNPIQSRCMVLLIERAGTSSSHAGGLVPDRVRPSGPEVERDDGTVRLRSRDFGKPAFSKVEIDPVEEVVHVVLLAGIRIDGIGLDHPGAVLAGEVDGRVEQPRVESLPRCSLAHDEAAHGPHRLIVQWLFA